MKIIKNPTMPKIFISYRRADAGESFTLATEILKKKYPEELVFIDIHSIVPGSEWPITIANSVRVCPVMLVFIGPNWVTEDDRRHGKGLHDPENWARKEILTSMDYRSKIIPVLFNDRKKMPEEDDLPEELKPILRFQSHIVSIADEKTFDPIYGVIDSEIERHLDPSDGLPRNPHLIQYEKDLIDEYTKVENGQAATTNKKLIQQGCPRLWPDVTHLGTATHPENPDEPPPLGDVGIPRDHDSFVVAKALFKGNPSAVQKLIRFREAGPRTQLYFPFGENANQLRVAILVSGGIAPGINAVIDGIVRRHWEYAESSGNPHYESLVDGLLNGLQFAHEAGNGANVPRIPLFANSSHKAGRVRIVGGVVDGIITSRHVNEGGSVIGTARVDKLINGPDRVNHLDNVARFLRHHYDIVYVVGGDGSMRAAHAINTVAMRQHNRAQNMDAPLSVVAVPKTMDNDILWVWQSFGFMSAVDRAREFIDNLSTEATSNPRLGIIQLFGSASGFIVSHAVLASSTDLCYLALIPEVPFRMKKIVPYLISRIQNNPGRQRIPSALVVLSETAIPMDAPDYLDISAPGLSKDERNCIKDIGLTEVEQKEVKTYCERRQRGGELQGQTNDALRRGGLKIVSRVIEWELKQLGVNNAVRFEATRIFTSEPRHLLRSIPPSPTDVITGRRLGSLAVDNALAGYTDFMISQWLTEFVLIPLKLVVLGRKRIPPNGIFWKSVCAKTGQPAVLDD